MGQLSSKKPLEAKHCTPLGLYEDCPWDLKAVKQMVSSKRIAPIFKGQCDERADLDECPICMLYYPFLNRSVCCKKYVCTECFLQIRKPPSSGEEAPCPFCQRAKYDVQFVGRKSELLLKQEREEDERVSRLERQATSRRTNSEFGIPISSREQPSELSVAASCPAVLSDAHGTSGGGASSSSAAHHHHHHHAPPAPAPNAQLHAGLGLNMNGLTEAEIEDLLVMEAIRISLLDDAEEP